jgi:HPt (histidine-containing phosphotransfer) domain-containing protein
MTAHAMGGDRERCLLAGMDDYITKPIDQPTLLIAMERIVHGNPAPLPEQKRRNAPGVEASENSPVALPASVGAGELDFDPAVAWKRVEGDRELLREVVELFISESPRLMEQVRHSIVAADSHGLERSAHALKGSVSNFGARSAQALAAQLEGMGRSGDLAGAGVVFTHLEVQIGWLLPALENILNREAA